MTTETAPMNAETIDALAEELDRAQRGCRSVPPLSDRYPGLAAADAYAIASRAFARRVARGERLVGRKIGLTSRAMQERFGVDEPDFGRLSDAMRYEDGEVLPARAFVQPMAEAEIAFVLRASLRGPQVVPLDVVRATEMVVPAFEIIDSRIRDWKIRLCDTIADNASSGAFVLGDCAADPRALDLRTCGVVLEKNGTLAGTGAGAASLGSPLAAVAWLANRLAAFDESLAPGDIVLSGALCPAVPVGAGDAVEATIAGIGRVRARFA